MNYLKDITKRQRVLLVMQAILYPLAILSPYFLTRLNATPCGDDCIAYSSSPQAVLSLGALFIFLTALAYSLLVPRFRNARLSLAYVKAQFMVAVASCLIWMPVYLVMRRYSQGAAISTYVSVNGELVSSNYPSFGLGISPSTVVLLSLAFLVPPLVKWYQLAHSKTRVAGIKKEKLFQ